MNVLLVVGLAIALSFAAGRLIHLLRLPAVTGYVVMGAILGSSVLRVFTPHLLDRVDVISDLALGVIAFTIGGELKIRVFKALGKTILYIATLEVIGAFVLVAAAMLLFTHTLYIALILGAVAAATAPAATVAVLQQYRARGPLTTTILAVVGLDDGAALVIYGFASSIARSLIGAKHSLSVATDLFDPLLEILGALGTGAVIGVMLSAIAGHMRDQVQLLTVAVSAIFICSGIAAQFHFSQLLSNMALAMTFVNRSRSHVSSQVLSALHLVGFPIIAGFFCLAGARLNVRLLPQIGLIGLVYTVARMIGKYSGATLGAFLVKGTPKVVRKYVGLSLWPQIGVAVALAIIVGKEFRVYGETGNALATLVIHILLFTTLITEVVGPIMTRWAVHRAGEAGAGERRVP